MIPMWAYVVALLGVTLILSDSILTDMPKKRLVNYIGSLEEGWRTRFLNMFFEYSCCAQCIGFLIGASASLLYMPICNWFLDGCLISALGYLAMQLNKK